MNNDAMVTMSLEQYEDLRESRSLLIKHIEEIDRALGVAYHITVHQLLTKARELNETPPDIWKTSK